MFKDLVSFNVIFPEIYIGTHKMVSYRSPKCKYTQSPGQGLTNPSTVRAWVCVQGKDMDRPAPAPQ